jgi:hypothetical protein
MNAQVHDFKNEELSNQRRLQAMAMQEIEGNPLTPEEISMFEMFEREGWPHDRRRNYILAQIRAENAE